MASPSNRYNTNANPATHRGIAWDFGSRRGWFRRCVNFFVLAVNVVAALALLLTGYGGVFNPENWGGWVFVPMIFPVVLLASLAIFIIDLIWWRRTALMQGVALLLCAGPIADFCPLNYPRLSMTDDEKANAIKIMTYNVFKFSDFTRAYEGNGNPTLDAILREDADIVCLQECIGMTLSRIGRSTPEQIDSVFARYPYVYQGGKNTALLSKYPAEPIPLQINSDTTVRNNGEGAAWRVHIDDDRIINLFNLHLRSLYLTPGDKEQFTGIVKDIVKLDTLDIDGLRFFRANAMAKIAEAAKARADQIKTLEKYIAKYGGKNVIVCGDFNDVNGCYGINSLCHESRLRRTYPLVAFGPTVTFHANHLFFRIDHILFRGDLEPYSISSPRIPYSDHYPLVATFIMK
ncbi:MAG: endonuclease/exonuclease/phosphatase family protein [Bacteroides sp.]|nr:endonuclease/exonuclease/phosphatase family protein [Bacteroides sp.]MCM1458244.1 endonuclease/exonuclease/phosphatase family protein [Lachnoclostridium sp.]